MEILFKILLSYLLGSISGAIIVGKFQGIDIRKLGSGNAGGTNAFRVMGAFYAFLVLSIDIIKGYIAVNFISLLKNNDMILFQVINTENIQIICGLAVVIGHIYPLFYGFKGGKGAGTMIGVLAALFPFGLFICFSVWLMILIITGFVGLGTMTAGIILPIATFMFYSNGIHSPFGAFTLIITLLIFYTHRQNIKRMLAGKEDKFEKIMLFSKKK